MAKSALPSTEHALLFIEDVMDRCMTPFFLLGDTAREVVDSKNSSPLSPIDTHSPIEVGIKKTSYSEYLESTLKMFLPPDTKWGKDKIEFVHLDTPVTLRIIKRRFKFLDHLDTVNYKITTFKIPNPFEKYWKQRGLVR